MNSIPQPIFLFSLPRSGSTLLQRILASHSEITTTSEPWILLPYLYSMKREGIYAEYGHDTLVYAIEDFCRELPGGKDDYLREIREIVLRLYAKANKNNTRYFLDKTPRYHLIVEDIINLLPEGKFVFLWRNPLAVVASMMETWSNGKWNINTYKVDLYTGLDNLIKAFNRHRNKVCAVRYEDILINPEYELKKLFQYLDIPFYQELLHHLGNTQLKGRMGDHVGTKEYQIISKEPLEKWKSTLSNPIRKAWCRQYLKRLGRERLTVTGYDLDMLLAELYEISYSSNFFASDILINSCDFTCSVLEYLKHKLESLTRRYRGRKNKNIDRYTVA